jgi:predicted RNA binding protein YcfA (HicA-like mRNA interferase family)
MIRLARVTGKELVAALKLRHPDGRSTVVPPIPARPSAPAS